MLNKKCTICSASEPYLPIGSAQKPVFADTCQFVVVTAYIDVQNSRSGDFHNDRRQTKPVALPLAHAHGVKTQIFVNMDFVIDECQMFCLKYVISSHDYGYSEVDTNLSAHSDFNLSNQVTQLYL